MLVVEGKGRGNIRTCLDGKHRLTELTANNAESVIVLDIYYVITSFISTFLDDTIVSLDAFSPCILYLSL